MNREELTEILATMRPVGAEPTAVEVTSGAREFPTRCLTPWLGMSRVGVNNRLRTLIERGMVGTIGAPRSPRRRYVWLGTTPTKGSTP